MITFPSWELMDVSRHVTDDCVRVTYTYIMAFPVHNRSLLKIRTETFPCDGASQSSVQENVVRFD
jgi:hypothetical protein